MSAYESVSSWKQATPASVSAQRTELLSSVANQICDLSDKRIRVAIDGFPASGKTVFADELAGMIRKLNRPTLRTSLDDFKHPWRDAREKGYDRITGFGYYKNAPDFESTINLLLRPAGSEGSGSVVLCAFDPLTGVDCRDVYVEAPENSILLVDSMFAFRSEYNDFWDFRIWLDIPAALSLSRGIERDKESEGLAEAESVHRHRYHEAEKLYLTEVNPLSLADLVIDNIDYEKPTIIGSVN